MEQPTTTAECVEILKAVLRCLDSFVQLGGEAPHRDLAFAAIRVQEAIDLIGSPDVLDS